MDKAIFYRLVDTVDYNGVCIRLHIFNSIKETRCGHWVIGEFSPSWLLPDDLIKRRFAKWISNTSVKKFCYQDVEDAKNSFLKRKSSQVSRLKMQLEQAEKALNSDALQRSTDEDLIAGINVGKTSFHDSIIFDY